MGLMDRLFGKPAVKPASQRPAAGVQHAGAPSTRGGANSPQSIRKELVRVTVRETLLHNGIPSAWIRADPLTTSAPGRDPGVHVRLVVKHWDARLMHHAVALQEHVEKRLLSLDPQAEHWLMGLSWQFDLDDVTHCPPLPHPGSWTSESGPAASARFAAAAPPATAPAQPSGDVISGPTRIAQAQPQPQGDDRRQALERMLRERDGDFGGDGSGFTRTQPMGFDKTQPMPAFGKSEPAAVEPRRPRPGR